MEISLMVFASAFLPMSLVHLKPLMRFIFPLKPRRLQPSSLMRIIACLKNFLLKSKSIQNFISSDHNRKCRARLLTWYSKSDSHWLKPSQIWMMGKMVQNLRRTKNQDDPPVCSGTALTFEDPPAQLPTEPWAHHTGPFVCV